MIDVCIFARQPGDSCNNEAKNRAATSPSKNTDIISTLMSSLEDGEDDLELTPGFVLGYADLPELITHGLLYLMYTQSRTSQFYSQKQKEKIGISSGTI